MTERSPYRGGHWMLRVVRGGPEVCARLWLCSHEPGEPDNRMDRPYWQGQIGLSLVPPSKVWEAVEFCEATPAQRTLLAYPPVSERPPRGNRLPALQYARLARWKQERARRISEAEFEAELTWHRWAEKNAPHHPDFTWRKPIDKAIAPVPRFS